MEVAFILGDFWKRLGEFQSLKTMVFVEGGCWMRKIVWNDKVCYGCRTCEIACSFHHKGVFSPELSSIRVSNNYQTSEIQLSVDSTCDLCEVEDQPLCVTYCLYKALRETA